MKHLGLKRLINTTFGMNTMITLTAKMKKKKANKLQIIAAFCTMLLCVFTTTITYAQDYSFSWSPGPQPVEGYKLYYKKNGTTALPFNGTAANEGSSPVNTGNTSTFNITGLEDNTTYHFALTAYNGSDESEFSEIITVSPSATNDPAPIIINISLK